MQIYKEQAAYHLLVGKSKNDIGICGVVTSEHNALEQDVVRVGGADNNLIGRSARKV